MRRISWLLLSVIFLLLALMPFCNAHARPECVAPAQLTRTTVRIMATIQIPDRDGVLEEISYGGTGFLVSLTRIVTVAHVGKVIADYKKWTMVTLEQHVPWKGVPLHRERIAVRIVGELDPGSTENLVVLELERPFLGNTTTLMRITPLERGEYITGVGYPDGTLRTVTGRYLGSEISYDTGRMRDVVHIEVADNGNRRVFGPGASGSPIFDCSGRAVLVLSSLLWSTTPHDCVTAKSRGACRIPRHITITRRPWKESTNLAIPTIGLVSLLESLSKKTTHSDAQ